MTNIAVEKHYAPSKTETFEALVIERICGHIQLDAEIVLAKHGRPFAKMFDSTHDDRALALKIVTQLNAATPPGSLPDTRPSPLLRQDRLARHYRECEENRTWAAHTIQSNMAECRIRFDLLQGYTIPNGGSPLATKAAAELYSCRQFVLGVLTGRTYALPESEQLALARSWEDLWDNTFGDLVGKVLKFQE